MHDDHRVVRKSGRPPAGVNGAKVAEYPQISLRVPPEVRRTLNALSTLQGRPHWRIMMEALAAYVLTLPPDERQVVEEIVRSSESESM